MDRNYFNRYADGYSPYAESDLGLIIDDLLEIIKRRPLRWACEVGSADGQFSFELHSRLPGPLSFVGLDVANQVLKKYPFHRVCGSAFNFPLADHSVDLLLFPASFHHLDPFEQILAEINRILAPGGILYCLEPNFFHPQRMFIMSWETTPLSQIA